MYMTFCELKLMRISPEKFTATSVGEMIIIIIIR